MPNEVTRINEAGEEINYEMKKPSFRLSLHIQDCCTLITLSLKNIRHLPMCTTKETTVERETVENTRRSLSFSQHLRGSP